ncbi:AAA-like domain-containing protein [Armatimonas rosea]|uniref:WD40 repeat protein/uncharacterized protein YoxC n=1 Tax=Armatimonas rosea TaxID=685828 RepID=A0A7W9SR88_ARMRO|nr:WD40 repeat protein/uncharacterized protein YoxC [Armatimonas rosea]
MSSEEPVDALSPKSSFFVTGGALGVNAPSYVVRQADSQLLTALECGELCYLLDTRQVGKTSLLARCGHQLRQQGHTTVLLDMSGLCSSDLQAGQWYLAMLRGISHTTQTTEECMTLWRSLPELAPLTRWRQALETIVLPRLTGRLYLFLDEIDALQNLTFPTQAFLGAIRELYQHRFDHPPLDRLVFCLAGAVTPSQLINDIKITPFNVGTQIEITNFTEEEAAPLLAGLGANRVQLLRRVLYWTGGHPYLTQSLCLAVRDSNVQSVRDVDRLCKEQFFSEEAWEKDKNVTFVRERVLGNADPNALLSLYLQVLQGPTAYDPTDSVAAQLRLSGLVIPKGGRLHVRNRIYQSLFGKRWVHEALLPAELLRQKKAMQQGVRRATAFYGALTGLVILGGLLTREARRADQATIKEHTTSKQLSLVQGELAQASGELKELQGKRLSLEQTMEQMRRDLTGMQREKQRLVDEKKRLQSDSRIRVAQLNASIITKQRDLSKIQVQVQRAEQQQRQLTQSRRQLLQRFGTARTVDEDRELLSYVRQQVQENMQQSALLQTESLTNLRSLISRPFFRRLRVTLPFVPRSQCFFPDGRRLLVAGESAWAVILDTHTGKVLQWLPTNIQGTLGYARISADGHWLILGAMNGEVHLRDLQQGLSKSIHVFKSGLQRTPIIAISGDSKYLFYSQPGSGGMLHNLLTGKTVEIKGSSGEITCADFGVDREGSIPTTTGLLLGSSDGVFQPWNVETGEPLKDPRTKDDSPINDDSPITSLLNSGPHDVVFARKNGMFAVWNWNQDFPVVPGYQDIRGKITQVNRMGEMILGLTDANVVQMWNYGTSQESLLSQTLFVTYEDTYEKIYNIVTSPENHAFSIVGSDYAVQIWQISLPLIPNGFGTPLHAEFASDGKSLLTATKEGHIRLSSLDTALLQWEGIPNLDENGNEIKSFTMPAMHQSAFLKKTDQFVAATRRGQIQVWKRQGELRRQGSNRVVLEGFKPLLRINAHKAAIQNFSYCPEQDLLISGSQDKTIKVWDTRDWHRLREIFVDAPVYSLRAARSARWVAAACSDGSTRVFDVSTGNLLTSLAPAGRELKLRTPTRPWDVEFTPDEQHVVVGETDGKVRIWDWKAKRLYGELNIRGSDISSVNFSPDARWLAVAGIAGLRSEGTVSLWRWPEAREALRRGETPRPALVVPISAKKINTVRFSPDSHWIVVASEDGLARVLPITAEACLLQSQKMLQSIPPGGGEVKVEFPTTAQAESPKKIQKP